MFIHSVNINFNNSTTKDSLQNNFIVNIIQLITLQFDIVLECVIHLIHYSKRLNPFKAISAFQIL